MNVQIETLVEQARKLAPEERIALAEEIMATVELSPKEWEAAWARECEDRLAAYERGEIKSSDSDEVMTRLRQKYGSQ